MKKRPFLRFFLTVWIVLFIWNTPASAAAGSLSAQVDGTLKAGKSFEVTLSSSVPLCAIELEIRYDNTVLEYKSAKAQLPKGEIRTRQTEGGMRLICASGKEKDGAILNLTFKALKNADTQIIFSPISSALSDEQLYDFANGVALSLAIGENGSFSSKQTEKDAISSKTSTADSRAVSSSSPDESVSKVIPDYYRKVDYLRIVLIAVGIAGLVATALFIGFRLGIRSKKQPPKPDEDDK